MVRELFGPGEDKVHDFGLFRPNALHRPHSSVWSGEDGQPRLSGESHAAVHAGEDAEVEVQCHSCPREEEQNPRCAVSISLGLVSSAGSLGGGVPH